MKRFLKIRPRRSQKYFASRLVDDATPVYILSDISALNFYQK